MANVVFCSRVVRDGSDPLTPFSTIECAETTSQKTKSSRNTTMTKNKIYVCTDVIIAKKIFSKASDVIPTSSTFRSNGAASGLLCLCKRMLQKQQVLCYYRCTTSISLKIQYHTQKKLWVDSQGSHSYTLHRDSQGKLVFFGDITPVVQNTIFFTERSKINFYK